jgi:hypothetical protein
MRPAGGIFLWADATKKIPETSAIPQIWPLIVLAKLQDARGTDVQDLIAQGSKTEPAVVIQGLTVIDNTGDALFNSSTFGPGVPKTPTPSPYVHFLVRPSAICFNAASAATIAQGGLLVTPFRKGPNPGSGPPEQEIDIADLGGVVAGSGGLISKFTYACLPKGRYAINAVYPTGQAWTTPNEAGNCAHSEGAISSDFSDMSKLTCTVKPRSVLYSQGTRAILEIVGPSDPNNCTKPADGVVQAAAVPDECLPCSERVNAGKFPECAP